LHNEEEKKKLNINIIIALGKAKAPKMAKLLVFSFCNLASGPAGNCASFSLFFADQAEYCYCIILKGTQTSRIFIIICAYKNSIFILQALPLSAYNA
jgi:hypothetical protein